MRNAAADEVAWPEDAVEIGRILDAWGVQGAFKVQPFSSDPQALFSSRRWFVRPPEGLRPGTAPLPEVLRVRSAREHGGVVVATADDIADRNAAEGLRGARLFVSRGSFPTPEPGEYYWVDLIGLAVLNRDGVELGRVVDLIDTGANSVLRVQPAGGEGAVAAERLIPFVDAYVDEVDLAQRRITVDWGLDY